MRLKLPKFWVIGYYSKLSAELSGGMCILGRVTSVNCTVSSFNLCLCVPFVLKSIGRGGLTLREQQVDIIFHV